MSQPLHKDCRPHIGFPPRPTHWRPSDKFWATENEFVHKDFDVPISDVFERAAEGRPSVSIDSTVLGGTPHIAGTRIPVFMVLDAIEYFGTLDGAIKSYPNLTMEQVKDAVSFASAVTEHPVDYEVESSPR